MFKLKWNHGCEPKYMSEYSAACDLVARETVHLAAGKTEVIPTGVWIEDVIWDLVPPNSLPELQIRARSGLSLRNAVTLANGIGTVDADFRDEICVIMTNHSIENFVAKKGQRIAQMVLNTIQRIPNISVKGTRIGGFGSTGL